MMRVAVFIISFLLKLSLKQLTDVPNYIYITAFRFMNRNVAQDIICSPRYRLCHLSHSKYCILHIPTASVTRWGRHVRKSRLQRFYKKKKFCHHHNYTATISLSQYLELEQWIFALNKKITIMANLINNFIKLFLNLPVWQINCMA